MDPGKFVHLHCHSHYSLLDGATRINEMVARAKAHGQPAIAITDHGNMFGAVEFYSAAKKAGVKPIIGCELYLAGNSRFVKEASPGREGKESFHLLVLAQNLTGYKNLMRLCTLGYTEGFYRKPRIDKDILRELSEGLICTSTCIGGEVPQAFLTRDRAAAEDMAKTYLSIFGPDRFFIELQDHGMDEQKTLNPELIDMARRLGVATIATNDVHYLDKDDSDAHDVLCCINTGANVDQEDRFRFPSNEFYLKSTQEMAALFPGHEEALANTLRVVELCNLEIDLSKRHAPVYRVPAEEKTAKGETKTDAEYLRDIVYRGATERYGEISDELRERIDYELSVITSKGFASYFLIVWDVVEFCRRHNIPVGARGSGCSAVVAYCLYISTPDPIRYGLYFERFMDPDRDEMPDIDLDICQNGRADVIDYVRTKYGHVAQIITFGTLKAKAAIKDVARVVGMGFEEANNLTKLVPNDLKMTIDKALKQEPELLKRYQNDPKVKRIVDVARKLEGVARNAGVHAAGVVVADQELVNFLPLYKASGTDALVTQFDGPTVEKVGLLKMDFLGLRTLTTLERARQLAEKSSGRTIDLANVDLTDPKVYEVFQRGDTKGIFQFESGGMRDVILRMRPNRIEDLIAANALYRPGPMEYIPDYVARKHGQPWTTPHPIMTEVLQETYGIMVYQEQVSRLVNRLGGIELKQAFRLAKAISKKKTDMIEAMRAPFVEGCEKSGVRAETANQVFEDILKFGGYAFNKAHSTGYAIVAYQTAWMKCYFPVEFMAALMTFEAGDTDKIAEYVDACRDMGISVEPPSINRSVLDFAVEKVAAKTTGGTPVAAGVSPAGVARVAAGVSPAGVAKVSPAGARGQNFAPPGGHLLAIRFGLGAIKGIGGKAVNAAVEERERGGEYKSLFDFCNRIDLTCINRAGLEALICAGAFDCTGAMRKGMFDAVERAIAAGQSAQRDRRMGQMSMFGDVDDDGGGDAFATASAGLSAEWSEAEMLARERAAMGLYITKHPLASCSKLLSACATATTVDLAKYADGDKVVLGGMVTGVRTVTPKGGRSPGKPMAIVGVEDLHGKTEAILFNKELTEFRTLVVSDAILFFEGEVDRKREQPSLRVTRVVPREAALENFAYAVLLDLDTATPIDRLVRLLREGRGTCPVYLNVPAEGGMIGQIMCAPTLRVACTTKMLAGMRSLLGDSAVRVLSTKRAEIPAALVEVG
jgi:DNA polymerase-3 subunit alpha